MAGFCTRCGRPLPEDGKCAFCPPIDSTVGYAPQEKKAPAPQGDTPSGFSQMISGYFAFVKAFIRNPAESLRRVEEDRDMGPGIVNAALLVSLVFFTSLITALVQRPFYAPFAAGGWLLESFLQPVIGLGAAFGGVCLLRLVGKERIHIRSVLSSVGAAAILPVAALAVTLPLHMFGTTFYDIIWMLPLCCAAVSLVFLTTRVYRSKMSVWQLLILCGVLLVGFLLLNRVQSFFLECIYSAY